MSYRQMLIAVLLILLGMCAAFGWWQNTHAKVGGRISTAKVLWIFLTLSVFFVIPAWMWRNSELPELSRHFWGWFFLGWVIRAVIEIPLLLATRIWRCWHGIAHDAVMLAFLLIAGQSMIFQDPASDMLIKLTAICLVAEMLNAFLFSRAGSPETGQYFASSDPLFLWINRITWIEILVLGDLLLAWLSIYVEGTAASSP